ncbi:MAG: adenylate/guanylate cyclase domain-containing protein [Acidimicrobiia bacterium]
MPRDRPAECSHELTEIPRPDQVSTGDGSSTPTLRVAPFATLTRLVDIGVDRTRSMAEQRWVRTINVVALAALLVSSSYCVFYTVLDFGSLWPVVVTNVIWNIGYVAVVVVNGRGNPRVAAWLAICCGLANTLVPAAFLGAGSGVYLFVVLIPMIGVMLSGPGDVLMRMVVLVVGAVAFAAMPIHYVNAPPVLDGTIAQVFLFASSAIGVALFGSFFALYYRWLVDQAEEDLAAANARSERLLLNILPEPVADQLKAQESSVAYRIDEVTVLFADLVDSTVLGELLPADEWVSLLDSVFSHLDDLTDEFGLEKVATIGDSYFAVAGLSGGGGDHQAAAVDLALAMRDAIAGWEVPGYGRLTARFGLACGPVVAGVIGKRKFRYDLWGDTVNTASRMETQSEPGMIQVTAELHRHLADSYEFRPRGQVLIKGKGLMETHFLTGRRTVERGLEESVPVAG